MSSSFVRVIPNNVYEELINEGVLSKFFPDDDSQSAISLLLAKLDSALRPRAKEILTKLEKGGDRSSGGGGEFSWNDKNEIIHAGVTWSGSNLVELLKYFILESKSFDQLEFSKNFASLISGGVNFQQIGSGGASISNNNEKVHDPAAAVETPPIPRTEEERHHRRKQTKPIKRLLNNTPKGVCKWVSFEDRFELK